MLKPYDITASLQGSVEQPEIDPSQLDEKQMRALMNQKILESFKAQQQRIQEAQKAYAEEVASPRNEAISKIDWRPFAQAVKGYGSTTVAVPTEGPEDRSEFKRKLQQDVQRAEQGLTDDEINYMKTQLADQQAKKAEGTQQRFEKAQTGKYFTQFVKDTQKIDNDLAGAKQSIYTVEQALMPGKDGKVNLERVRQSLSNFARLMGEKGVLTDDDISRQLYKDAEMRAMEIVGKLDKGALRVDSSSVQAMREALDVGKKATKQAVDSKMQFINDTYGEPTAPSAPMFYGAGGKNIMGKLQKKYDEAFGGAQPANAEGGKKKITAKDIDSMSLEELKEAGLY